MDIWSLLADFIKTWIIDLVPRPLIVRKTHSGLRFIYGKKVKKLLPGFYFYWPFVTEIELYPTVRQTTRLPTQCFMDIDGHPLVVGAVLVYEIGDIIRALSEVLNIDETIEDISLATIKSFIIGKSIKGLAEEFVSIDRELTLSIRKKLTPFGVKLLNAYLSDCTPAQVTKHYGIQLNETINSTDE